MIRSLLRLLAAPKPAAASSSSPQITLYAHLPKRTKSTPNATPLTAKATPNHRQRLLSMRLEHTRLCSAPRCERLRQLGIITAGDMAQADPESLAKHFGAPRKAAKILRQYRRAIRFAASVPGMMPPDAMLLISIHRRSARGLASESAAKLYRDLERFSLSTQGQQQLRGRRLPSTRRLKRWIAQCESSTRQPSIQSIAA